MIKKISRMSNSLYIHIPFCQNRCNYCGFCSSVFRQDLALALVQALSKQIKALEEDFETIYLGGGTPTVLGLDLLRRLFRSLKKISASVKEFTIEANPENLDQDRLKLFFDSGVNRISIGCQSFNSQKLRFLGRTHSAYQAKQAVFRAKKNGFDNISLDLIFGLPAEPLRVWEQDYFQAVMLPVRHLSIYMLSYEEGTRLFNKLKRKELIPLPDKELTLMYKQAIGYLSRQGFKHYEISNLAQRGFSCLHNFKCWENKPYLGLGPSAVSFDGKKRQKNINSVLGYIKAVENNRAYWRSAQEFSNLQRAKETAALKIRTIEGIDLEWFKLETGFDLEMLLGKELSVLLGQKLIRYTPGAKRITLTAKGTLFADTVSAEFI